jgi:hypothetical protein
VNQSRRIVIPNIGNGKSLEKRLTENEIGHTCEPITLALKQLIGEIVTPSATVDVKAVRWDAVKSTARNI